MRGATVAERLKTGAVPGGCLVDGLENAEHPERRGEGLYRMLASLSAPAEPV